MKIVSVNLGLYGSTGKIVQGLHDQAIEQHHEYLIMAPRREGDAPQKDVYEIGNRYTRRLNAYLGIATGLDGCVSVFSTIRMIRRMKMFAPDVIHLHNLHNYYVNLPILFYYIKRHDIPVIWTLHDCWSFTGHCPHFTYEKCEKWRYGCSHCPRYREYPKSLYDHSKRMWRWKRRWFSGVSRMTIVTPSEWLAELVRSSYLQDYPVTVIHNGIDLSVFRPVLSNFVEKHQLVQKKIVLGVAYGWSNQKGLDVFAELSNTLPDDYQIVLVGADEKIEHSLPGRVLTIPRTNDQRELAQIYSAADVFVNPTREDTFPTVNLEALGCGTPVVTFDTGGSPETIDATCGCVVPCDDVGSLRREIIRVAETKPYAEASCVKRSEQFQKTDRFDEYLRLYEGVMQS